MPEITTKNTRPVYKTDDGKTRFAFPVKILRERCYRPVNKDGSLGAPHIIGVASSDSLDSYGEYFSLSALSDMVEYAKTRKDRKEEGLVDLRETHWDTFSMGTLFDGWLDKNAATDRIEFYLDVELKEEDNHAMELFNNIIDGVEDKQMSVGGWIDWVKGDDAFEWEEREFEDEDGNIITFWVGRINHFILEHVAVTLPGWAANDDTRFIDALLRTGGNPLFQNHMTKSKEEVMQELRSVSPSPGGVRNTKSAETNLSTTREESHMPEAKVESDNSKKAMKAGELLRTQLDSVPVEERGEVEKGLREMLGFAEATPIEKTDETPDETSVEKADDDEVPAVEKTDETPDPEVIKTDETPDPEVVKTEEAPEVPVEKSAEVESLITEISVLRSELETIQTRTAELATSGDESGEKLDSFKTFADAVVEMSKSFDARLRKIETLNGVSKSASGELGEDVTASPVERVETARKSIWAPY